MRYEELLEEEKAAIDVALSPSTAIGVLRNIFGNQLSNSTLYRRLYEGQRSLKNKGLLNFGNACQLTDLGFSIMPPDKLAKSFQTWKIELNDREEKLCKSEEKANSCEVNSLNLKADKEKLEGIVEKLSLLKESLDAFGFLGVDENWASALICTTILEFAIKDKLEKLGCSAGEICNLNFENLTKRMKESMSEKEGRKFEGLFDPASIRITRNKLVHEGYKTRISKDEANAVLVITKNIIKNIGNSKLDA